MWEENARQFCSDFLQAEPQDRFVMGSGEYAQSIADALPIAGFVDDFAVTMSRDGIPVIRANEVPSQALTVVASMLRPRAAMTCLDLRGLRVLDYFAFARFSSLPIKPVTFWIAFKEDYLKHTDRYLRVRDRLADNESIELFDNLVKFRMTSDLRSMRSYEFEQENQYFESFLKLSRANETFLDIGSFDGQTSLQFASRVPHFSHIHAFEPSPRNAKKVRENLSFLAPRRTTVHNFGLGSESDNIRFDSKLGSASRASSLGTSFVKIRTLDSLQIPNPTFIKMDIEGFEVPALLGAIGTIRVYEPRLAISVYHRFDDLRRIPEVVDLAKVPYRIYLRHYTEGIDETVMFFVPESLD